MADSFGIDDDMVAFAVFAAADDIVDQLLLIVVVLFRQQDIFRPVGDAAPERDSMMLQRSWLDEVSRTLSIACMAVLTAVSKPIV